MLGCCVDEESIVPVEGSPVTRSADGSRIGGVFDGSFDDVVSTGGAFGGDTRETSLTKQLVFQVVNTTDTTSATRTHTMRC